MFGEGVRGKAGDAAREVRRVEGVVVELREWWGRCGGGARAREASGEEVGEEGSYGEVAEKAEGEERSHCGGDCMTIIGGEILVVVSSRAEVEMQMSKTGTEQGLSSLIRASDGVTCYMRRSLGHVTVKHLHQFSRLQSKSRRRGFCKMSRFIELWTTVK